MLTFRNMELDFDIYDADQAETYEAALERVLEDSGKKIPNEGLADGIRRQCGIVFDFFDDLFGDGFHKEIFGNRTNLGVCLDAFKEFTDLVNAQKGEMDARLEQYVPNRAARRAAPVSARKATARTEQQ